MKFLIAFVFIGIVSIASASENSLASCQPIAIQAESIMLSTKKPVLIMLHNLSQIDLWITHPVSEPGASAGSSSHLQEDKWSALLLDKEGFELSCIESKPGHEQQVPCVGLIAACRLVIKAMPSLPQGTFWAGENMTLSELLAYLGGRGYELPASN